MGNESEGKGWRRNIWGTRVREKDREEIYGEQGRKETIVMEKYEMKEIHTKEELTKVFEEEEDLVIVQHKRVARVLLRFAGHLSFEPQIKEVLTFIPLTAPKKILGTPCVDTTMTTAREKALYVIVRLHEEAHEEAVEAAKQFGAVRILLVDYELFAEISRQENPHMDFLCVGFTKCGTTSLSNALRECPEIVLPKGKETFYMHWRNKYDDAPERFRHKYFPEQDPDKLYGDIEPSYHGSARNVYECFGPEVKLLFLVRQPSLATFSYYKMLMRRPRNYRYVRYYQGFHRYSVKLFTKFANEEIYTERKDRFQYDKWINEYLQYFRPEQIKVVVMEELMRNPEEQMKEIQEFIGVKHPICVEQMPNSNEGSAVSANWLGAYINYRYYASIRGRKENTTRSKKQKLFFRFARWVQRYTTIENHDKMTDEQKRKMDAFYKPSVERLEKMTGLPVRKLWDI